MRWRCADTRDVTAVAYARLKAGDIDVLGIAEDRTQWNALIAANAMSGARELGRDQGVVGDTPAGDRGRVSRRRGHRHAARRARVLPLVPFAGALPHRGIDTRHGRGRP
jgi:hypothetical protein